MPHITYFGKPWMFVLRDAAQFAKNIDDVYRQFETTNRTMMIHLGIGSVPDKLFRGFDYAANFLYMYTDKNYTHYDTLSHPQLDGIFYYDKTI